MVFEIRLDLGIVSAVLLGLLLFGIGYNAFVAWLGHRNYTEGFLSLIVATGVFVTLVGVAVLSIEAALLTLGAFIASGTPMIVGSIVRYIQKRESAKKALIEEVKN